MAHELPPLPYDYAALEPVIDTATMKLHHDMHHAAYVKNLNAALEKHPNLQSKSAEDLIRDLNAIPEDIRGAVRNNGGGHVNHSMFWKIMKPQGGGDPTGPIAQAISKAFGSFKDFQTKFNDAGVKQFGSGWAWLAAKPNGDLQVLSTAEPGQPHFARPVPHHGQRCVGARLLLEVQQPPSRIFGGVVERGELGGDQQALRIPEVRQTRASPSRPLTGITWESRSRLSHPAQRGCQIAKPQRMKSAGAFCCIEAFPLVPLREAQHLRCATTLPPITLTTPPPRPSVDVE